MTKKIVGILLIVVGVGGLSYVYNAYLKKDTATNGENSKSTV